MSLFSYFESRVPNATAAPPAAVERDGPPPGLVPFYLHFVRQSPRLYVAMFVFGATVALLDTVIPLFIGKTGRADDHARSARRRARAGAAAAGDGGRWC